MAKTSLTPVYETQARKDAPEKSQPSKSDVKSCISKCGKLIAVWPRHDSAKGKVSYGHKVKGESEIRWRRDHEQCALPIDGNGTLRVDLNDMLCPVCGCSEGTRQHAHVGGECDSCREDRLREAAREFEEAGIDLGWGQCVTASDAAYDADLVKKNVKNLGNSQI